ncbi:MAG: sensor histidine kinase [Desulfobulbus sp.]
MDESISPLPIPPDLEKVCKRIQEKATSYERYNFSQGRNDFLKAFFDLAQEYDTLEDFYRICVSVPLALAGLHSALFLYDGRQGGLQLVCTSDRGMLAEPEPAPDSIRLSDVPYDIGPAVHVVPIFSKYSYSQQNEGAHDAENLRRSEQNRVWSGLHDLCFNGRTLGMYAVSCEEGLSDTEKFFLGKYANRIGYNLDNRLIARQNIERLKFINSLIVDIEHNIIVPNMYFRHLFNQLKRRIIAVEEVRDELEKEVAAGEGARGAARCVASLQTLQDDLFRNHQEIVKHHAIMSLFIESLLRREHFECGRLVLHTKRCFVEKEVILPQLEHYASRLKAAHITVDRPRNMLEEEFPLMVDIGLLAQVYANLFSNAAKYTKEIIDHAGRPRKAVAYGRELVEDFIRPGQKGVKFNVFSTGPSMSLEEGNRLFRDGVRGEQDQSLPGTGHGLSFIRMVVEMHGGLVGFEPTPEGNNFYFILPLPPLDPPSSPSSI